LRPSSGGKMSIAFLPPSLQSYRADRASRSEAHHSSAPL
jgi:hypothetical protein